MNEREIIRHSRVPGMSVFLNTVRYRSPHFHPEWELVLVLDGTLRVTCSGKSFLASRDALMLFQPDLPHEFSGEETGTILCLQLSPEVLGELSTLTLAGESLISGALSESSAEGIRLKMREILNTYLTPCSGMTLRCLGEALLLFSDLFQELPVRPVTEEERRASDKRSGLLNALFQYVNENYMHKIRLTDFALQQGYSMSWLSHFIKDTLSMSFQDYVTLVRVNSACRMMDEGDAKNTEIALSAGFSDYRYFSEAFRRQFHMTPGEYRRSIQKPEDAVIHRSIHSLEQFYTDEQSLALIKKLS